MRKAWRSLLVMAIIFAMVVFVGCRGTEPSEVAFELLTDHMAANNLDLPYILTDWIIAADAVVDNTDDYNIIDIRSAADYALGHIGGAVNSSLGNVLDAADADASGKPILVVCYTGQAASHAVVALRLSGYPDARVLKFGMSSWNAAFDRWTDNTASIAVGNDNWTTTATAAVDDFEGPDMIVMSSGGAGILAERVDAMLAGGFKGITASDVLASPAGYFINNYWTEADVAAYGHIAGAYRIKEGLTLVDEGFNHLNPGETVVTYCWTGQTSSMITAYLTVLGYDAKSLKFGTNAMIYSELQGHKWSASFDYAYVTD